MAAHIFIVEDHPLMLQITSEFVASLPGLTVGGTAATAEEALDRLSENGTRLVLADVSLPAMSGIELVAEVQKRRPSLPFLMFSAHQEVSYVEQALAAGARGYVVKGNPSELEEALRCVLGGGHYLTPKMRERLNRQPGPDPPAGYETA